jgi:chromate transporter
MTLFELICAKICRLSAHPGLPMNSKSNNPTATVPLASIYGVFFRLGLVSFGGGVSAWLYREIVEVRRWVTPEAFMAGYALGQILPGVNATNITVYIGQRLRGASGAVAALAGLLSAPFVIVLAAAAVYRYLLDIPGFEAAMAGVAAVAVGMLLRLGVVLARRFPWNPVPVAIMTATFVAVGILNWPLIAVVLTLAPVSIAAAWLRPANETTSETGK